MWTVRSWIISVVLSNRKDVILWIGIHTAHLCYLTEIVPSELSSGSRAVGAIKERSKWTIDESWDSQLLCYYSIKNWTGWRSWIPSFQPINARLNRLTSGTAGKKRSIDPRVTYPAELWNARPLCPVTQLPARKWINSLRHKNGFAIIYWCSAHFNKRQRESERQKCSTDVVGGVWEAFIHAGTKIHQPFSLHKTHFRSVFLSGTI